jgi:hypothetical protein
MLGYAAQFAQHTDRGQHHDRSGKHPGQTSG